MAQYFRVKRALWAAGFGRYGWPESVGGLGGPTMLRLSSVRRSTAGNSPTRASGR